MAPLSMTKPLRSAAVLAAIAVIVVQAGSKPHVSTVLVDQPSASWSHSQAPGVLQRACGNCHSNRTQWPWYSHIAPVSWWIAYDVHEGKKKFDFPWWETYTAKQKRDRLDSICGLISTGRMPPRLYTAMHPEAKLKDEDKKTLCAWAKLQTVAE